MKVYFTASPRGKKFYEKEYKSIYSLIEKLGYSNVNDDILSTDPEVFYDKLNNEGRSAEVELFNQKLNAIQAADINIFECTIPGLGLGFIIQKSIELNKPTIVLYLNDNSPHFLLGVDSEKLIVKSYNQKNVSKVLKESLELARERRDKRFNFFLSPKLLEYLESASSKEGVTKSKLIRDMIVEHMRKNSEE